MSGQLVCCCQTRWPALFGELVSFGEMLIIIICLCDGGVGMYMVSITLDEHKYLI